LAAAHPAKTDDLYFVANGAGGHVFSSTLKEHHSAVQKWRDYEKAAKAKADAEEKAKAQASEESVPIPANASGASAEQKDSTAQSSTEDGKTDAGAEKQAAASPASKSSPANTTGIPLPIRKPKTH
jgi:UPF0755 protein